jgi:hypothetical protein
MNSSVLKFLAVGERVGYRARSNDTYITAADRLLMTTRARPQMSTDNHRNNLQTYNLIVIKYIGQ